MMLKEKLFLKQLLTSNTFEKARLWARHHFKKKVDVKKKINKFIWKCTGLRLAKIMMKKKEKVGGLMFSETEIYCKATVLMYINEKN